MSYVYLLQTASSLFLFFYHLVTTAFFMAKGKQMERKTDPRDVDLFKLSSLHAQFKKKIRATIMELQEEQEQIEGQNATFLELQDQVQNRTRKSRLGMDGHSNMIFLLLQEIM